VTFWQYALGMAGLAATLAVFGWIAWTIRTALFPGWNGAPARLVEVVLAVAGITVVCQTLGMIGLFGGVEVLIASLLLAGMTRVSIVRSEPSLLRHRDRTEVDAGPGLGLVAWSLVLVAVIFLLAHWWTGVQASWGQGMYSADTIWYHGPMSARIAAEGTAWPLHFTDTEYLNWFYPGNSELQHALGIAFLGNDLLSPLINLAWLAVALLSAWCIGRRFGVAPLTLVAAAIVLDTGNMIPREAGTMANDVAPVAMLLAAGAILVTASGRTSFPSMVALLVTGISSGLALGTKLTALGAFAALFILLAAIAPPARRWRTLGVLLLGTFATAGIWPIRNLALSGNPIPWLQSLGPVDLPGPGRGLEGRDPYSVAHYIFVNPDGEVWGTYILDGLHNVLGPVWIPILLGAALGALIALIRPRIGTVRALGAAAAVGAITYVFTPLTAAGPEGDPFSFTANLRYLAPALTLGLCLLPLEPRLAPERARTALLAGGLFALVLTGLFSDSAASWDEPFSSVSWALFAGLVLVGAGAVVWRVNAGLGLKAAMAALVAMSLVGAGVLWAFSDDYLENRYSRDFFSFQPDGVATWAKPLEDQRVAVVGSSGAFTQYTLYGDDLSNHVQYLGRRAPGGDFRAITDCAGLLEALNKGNYDYLVTTPTLDLNRPTVLTASPERVWVLGNTGVREVRQNGLSSVFEITGELSVSGCRPR
jgi:hypothetical protein